MDKYILIRKELEKLGIKNQSDLQKAIQSLPALNLYMFTNKQERIRA